MNYDLSIKISIFGDAGNGKTSLINRFVNNKFTADNCATMGIDCKVKTININNKTIKIFIWDTAGQERYSPIIKPCYRDTDGIIITYDTTNYESFTHLHKWMDEIKNIIDIDEIEIMLVGTKSDLYHERAVPIEEVIDFVNLYGMRYLETSAKEGTNIDMIFSLFSEKIYNRKINGEKPIVRRSSKLLAKNEIKKNKQNNSEYSYCCYS
jgi:small GTP-binding protein